MRLLLLFFIVSFSMGHAQVIEEVLPKTTKMNETKELTLDLASSKELPSDIEKYTIIKIKGYEHLEDIDFKWVCHGFLEVLTIEGFGVLATAESLPVAIGNAKKLKKLIITGRKLNSLPPEIGNLNELEMLYIRGNQRLKTLPKEIGQLKKLKFLRIDSFSLETIPDEIGGLLNLEYLILNPVSLSNGLTSLPESIVNLKVLKELDINSHSLVTIPDGISGLTNLEKMNLEGEFNWLPADFFNLKKLENLRIDSSKLIDIPNGLGGLESLRKLRLVCGSLKNSVIDLREMPNLWSLTINVFNDESISFENTSSESLTSFFINGNNLSKIEGLKSFVNLESLGLAYTALEEIPSGVFSLKKLRRLTVSNAQLTSIPKELKQNVGLKEILLNNNKISGKIPTDLLKLPNLKSLWLRGNGEISNIGIIQNKASFRIFH